MTSARRLGAGERDCLIVKRNLPRSQPLSFFDEFFGVEKWKVMGIKKETLHLKAMGPLDASINPFFNTSFDADLWTGIEFRKTLPEAGAPLQIVEGLKAVAQERGVTVAEAAAIGILAECPPTGPDIQDIIDIVEALKQLSAPELYVKGILGIASQGPKQRKQEISESTNKLLRDTKRVKGDEHIEYIEKAYLFLTGEKFPDDP